jgi:hypothetical protein
MHYYLYVLCSFIHTVSEFYGRREYLALHIPYSVHANYIVAIQTRGGMKNLEEGNILLEDQPAYIFSFINDPPPQKKATSFHLKFISLSLGCGVWLPLQT